MDIPPSVITEKDIFRGKELITINVEVPKELVEDLIQTHTKEISEGRSSLTIEQYNGAVLQVGYNWLLYSGLKKFFEK